MPDLDGPLPLARRRLSDAVHALADPVPVWDGGVCRGGGTTPLLLRPRHPKSLPHYPCRCCIHTGLLPAVSRSGSRSAH